MILGGSRYALPLIKIAHEMDIYVITADYIPNNIAHRYSDEYVNVSIIEKELVLKAAEERNIDGIVSFACDPGVVVAAYVAEKMGLPFQCSYESACILQDKGRFRQFLTDNAFNCPKSKRYEDLKTLLNELDYFNWPVIVKPTDSAGSKGVTKVNEYKDISSAVDKALKASHNNAYIVEDFLTFEGYHSSTDMFTVDGELKFVTYSDQLFDVNAENPYTPAYIIWPTTMKEKYQNELTSEIQRLMKLLGMKTGIYNIETCVANGKTYIMEVSPRGGGCKIAELQNNAFGVDLIKAEIKKAIGLPIDEIKQTNCKGHWCEMVFHARPGQTGILKSINIDPQVKNKYLRQVDLSVKEGDFIMPFTGANMSIGDLFFRFNSRKELNEVMKDQNNWLNIEIK